MNVSIENTNKKGKFANMMTEKKTTHTHTHITYRTRLFAVNCKMYSPIIANALTKCPHSIRILISIFYFVYSHFFFPSVTHFEQRWASDHNIWKHPGQHHVWWSTISCTIATVTVVFVRIGGKSTIWYLDIFTHARAVFPPFCTILIVQCTLFSFVSLDATTIRKRRWKTDVELDVF